MADGLTARPSVLAATVIGVGMGGFFDGIVLHQIFQLHNMLSAKISNETMGGMKANMVWDGLFHGVVWIATLAGIVLLWNAARRREVAFDARYLVGGFLLGWGLFNVVEGVIDHHILHTHHVVEQLGLSGFDYAFLAWGAGMVLIGWWLVRKGPRAA